jgi:hypothetical protein
MQTHKRRKLGFHMPRESLVFFLDLTENNCKLLFLKWSVGETSYFFV